MYVVHLLEYRLENGIGGELFSLSGRREHVNVEHALSAFPPTVRSLSVPSSAHELGKLKISLPAITG